MAFNGALHIASISSPFLACMQVSKCMSVLVEQQSQDRARERSQHRATFAFSATSALTRVEQIECAWCSELDLCSTIVVGTSHAVLDESGARNELDGRLLGFRHCYIPNQWSGQSRSGCGHNHTVECGCRTHWQGTAQREMERRATYG